MAKGKWIFKLDADDYINDNFKIEFIKHMNNMILYLEK